MSRQEIGSDELLDVRPVIRESEKVRTVYKAAEREEHFLFNPFDSVHEFNLSKVGEFLKNATEVHVERST